MNIFVIHSFKDKNQVDGKIKELRQRVYHVNILMLKSDVRFWKNTARKKLKRAELVLYIIGEASHKSVYIDWEINEAKRFNKQIVTMKLDEGYELNEALRTANDFNDEKSNAFINLDMNALVKFINEHESGEAIENKLFRNRNDTVDATLLLEQYKLFLKTSEDLVSRRQAVNNFYITINSILVTLLATFYALNVKIGYAASFSALVGIIGIILSISWIQILISYGRLNASKMKIISTLEKRLPADLFDAEWAVLSSKLNAKKYRSFTESESLIPKIFICIHGLVIILAACILIL